jgi:hypothetical protein
MKLAVRRASPDDKDRNELFGLIKRNLEIGDNYEARLRWYNALNPAGSGWTWFLHEENRGSAVGTASLFRRQVYVNGERLTVGQVMFFAVNNNYRSLGPAMMLQRATFEPVDAREIAFCYDCPPHDQGMSTFVRLGMHANCEIMRYVLPLKSDEYLARRLGTGFWTKSLVAVSNVFLHTRRSHHVSGLNISPFDDAFGDEFSRLDSAVSTSGLVRCSRSADVLNWLYRRFPLEPKRLPNGLMEQVRVLVARRGGELLAFAACHNQTDNLMCIKDVFGVHLEEVGRPLLETVIEIAVKEQMRAVYAYSTENSEFGRLLQESGFRPRDRAARVVAYDPARRTEQVDSNLRWAFTNTELMV